MAESPTSSRALRLIVHEPAERVLDCPVLAATAEDATGRFGLRPGMEPLVAVLVSGLLSYRQADGIERLVAVGPGVLHAERDQVRVAVRRAVPCESLEEVRAAIAADSSERRQGAQAMRDAFRNLYRRLVRALAEEERVR